MNIFQDEMRIQITSAKPEGWTVQEVACRLILVTVGILATFVVLAVAPLAFFGLPVGNTNCSIYPICINNPGECPDPTQPGSFIPCNIEPEESRGLFSRCHPCSPCILPENQL